MKKLISILALVVGALAMTPLPALADTDVISGYSCWVTPQGVPFYREWHLVTRTNGSTREYHLADQIGECPDGVGDHPK